MKSEMCEWYTAQYSIFFPRTVGSLKVAASRGGLKHEHKYKFKIPLILLLLPFPLSTAHLPPPPLTNAAVYSLLLSKICEMPLQLLHIDLSGQKLQVFEFCPLFDPGRSFREFFFTNNRTASNLDPHRICKLLCREAATACHDTESTIQKSDVGSSCLLLLITIFVPLPPHHCCAV